MFEGQPINTVSGQIYQLLIVGGVLVLVLGFTAQIGVGHWRAAYAHCLAIRLAKHGKRDGAITLAAIERSIPFSKLVSSLISCVLSWNLIVRTIVTAGAMVPFAFIDSPFDKMHFPIVLALLLIQILALWPVFWRARTRPSVFIWALVVLLFGSTPSVYLYFFMPGASEAPVVSAMIISLVCSISLGWLATKLVDPETWRSIAEYLKAWLHTERNAPDGVYCRIAFWIILVISSLLMVAQLIDTKMVVYSAPGTWLISTLVSIFVLIYGRHRHLSTIWQTCVIVIFTGAIVSALLSYPTLAWLIERFTSQSELGVFLAHRPDFVVRGVLGMLLVLAVGPLAVLWSRPQRWQGRVAVGAVAGAMVGALVFGELGGSAAGIVAQSPLYGVAFSRIGYGADEWLLKLAIAVSQTFPVVYGAFWMLITGGALVCGLTGFLTPVRLVRRDTVSDTFVFWVPVIVPAILLLSISMILNAIAFAYHSQALQSTFNPYGFVPHWRTDWIIIAAVGQPWLASMVIQALYLYKLQDRIDRTPAQPLTALVACFIVGLIDLVSLGLLLLLCEGAFSQEVWTLIPLLVTLSFGLEMFFTSWRLWRSQDASNISDLSNVNHSTWAAVGSVSGLLVAALLCQPIVVLLGQIGIGIQALGVILEHNSPPPGAEWLHGLFSTFWLISSCGMAALTIGCTAIASAVGWSMTHWQRSWAPWTWFRHRRVVSILAAFSLIGSNCSATVQI
ncbi:MAG: hypothetical protein JW934_14710 [Anaerolineae bacterium]|nr:hypothetical protein [Anaerolineae bacterium]